MANLYTPDQLGIKPDTTGGVFKNGAWYNGRMYYNGTLTDPGVAHPDMGGVGAGQPVSSEVNRQSDLLQGLAPGGIDAYLESQRKKSANIAPAKSVAPTSTPGGSTPATGADVGTGIGAGTGGLLDGTASPSINLPDLYKSLYKDSGIETLQADLSSKEKAYNDAVSKINDNPWLSEATRTGRLKKLSTDYENATASLKNDIVTKKADIETQLALQTKQFDINTEQAKLALSQFDTLLNMGALDNASGDEIAAITRTTGLTSSMIKSAIKTRADKSVETSTISYDDGTDQGFAIINSKTGEIISKQKVASSKPSTAKPTDSEQKSYYANALRLDAQKGLKLGQIFSIYTGYLDPDTIYQLYNANSKYGPDKGDVSALKSYGVTQPSNSVNDAISGLIKSELKK